jgi:hypothetical protein
MARLPSHPSRLSGHRRHQPFKLIKGEPAKQPALPKNYTWPDETKEWWAMWGRSPLSTDFTENDWSELLICAKLHATIWSGPPSKMITTSAELRQRVAKFGATPLDRQRLRITLAVADLEESRAEDRQENQERKRAGARQRRGPHLVEEATDG